MRVRGLDGRPGERLAGAPERLIARPSRTGPRCPVAAAERAPPALTAHSAAVSAVMSACARRGFPAAPRVDRRP